MRLFGCAESTAFYFPTREQFATPAGFEDVSITTPDGVKLHAWFMPARGRGPDSGPAPAVLHSHGNAGNVSSHAEFSRFLPHHGVSVLIFDYRSYGRSEQKGQLGREACLTDTLAAYDYLRSRKDVDPKRIGVYGVSLGAAFALALAAEHPEIRSVCTVAAFSSFSSVANDHIPILGSVLIPGGMEGTANVARLGTRPLLIVHGDADNIVAPYHADRLEAAAKAAGVPVTKLIIPGGGHNDAIFMDSDAQDQIGAFFVRTLAAP